MTPRGKAWMMDEQFDPAFPMERQALYRLEPPLQHHGRAIEHVVVSAVKSFGRVETQIFETAIDGSIAARFGNEELPGGLVGVLDHVAALRNCGVGYVVRYYAPPYPQPELQPAELDQELARKAAESVRKLP